MQEQQIAALFDKHDIDAAELVKLKYDIAKEHYVKGELDLRFDKLEASFTKGFDSLGDKFDKLADTLVDHMRKEDARHDRE